MATNLNKTKRRINSVNSTKKITKAMELVATVKLKRFKDVMFQNEKFTDEIVSLINALFKNLDETDNVYISPKDAKKDLCIVINSNLGLCAGFNNDIYHFVDQNIDKSLNDILSIGGKGNDYFTKNGYEVISDFAHLNEHIEYSEIKNLARYVSDAFTSSKYKKVKIVYTKYVNSIKFIPSMIDIFPLKKSKEENEKVEYGPIFDPNVKTLIDELVPIYVNTLLYQRIIESQVSEQASRRSAMENATDNADELISQLTIEYNKARQAAITQEITEVIAGQKL